MCDKNYSNVTLSFSNKISKMEIKHLSSKTMKIHPSGSKLQWLISIKSKKIKTKNIKKIKKNKNKPNKLKNSKKIQKNNKKIEKMYKKIKKTTENK